MAAAAQAALPATAVAGPVGMTPDRLPGLRSTASATPSEPPTGDFSNPPPKDGLPAPAPRKGSRPDLSKAMVIERRADSTTWANPDGTKTVRTLRSGGAGMPRVFAVASRRPCWPDEHSG